MPEHPNDEQMAWAVLDLPDWANEIVSWVAGGQSWPKGSETMLEELGSHWEELAAALETATTDYAQAATTLSGGWEGPSFQQFYNFAEAAFFKMDGGLPVMTTMAGQYAQQARGFATEVNYAKISINIAFYIAVIAAFISLLAAFFTGGGSLVIGAGIREALVAAIRLAMQKLLTAAGRTFVQDVVKKMVVREVAVAARRSAVREVVTRVGHEVVEEVAEEVFIDAATQTIQMQQGHRTSYDYNRTIAAGIGGGIGGLVGSGLSNPLSRVARPGNAVGRHLTDLALSAGTNVIASPTGSFMANGLVYGNWNLTAAFTPQALLGAATTAAGRYNTASPFSPDTIADLRTATTHFAADATGLTAPSVAPGMPSPLSTSPSTQPGSQAPSQGSGPNGSQPGSQSSTQPGSQAPTRSATQHGSQAGTQSGSQTGSQASGQDGATGSQTSGQQPGTQNASQNAGAQSAPQHGSQTEASPSSQTHESAASEPDPTSTTQDRSAAQNQSSDHENPQAGPQDTYTEAQADNPSTPPAAAPSPDQAGNPSTSTAPSAETASSADVANQNTGAVDTADPGSSAESGSVAQQASSSLPDTSSPTTDAPTSGDSAGAATAGTPGGTAAQAPSAETATSNADTTSSVDSSPAPQQYGSADPAPGAAGPSDQQSLRSRIAAFVSPAVAFNVPVVPVEVRLAAASVATGSFDTHGVALGATQISAAFRHTFTDGSSVARSGADTVDAARNAYARIMSGDATQADVDLLTHQVVEATALQHITALPSPRASTAAQEADRAERHRRDATAIADQVAPGVSLPARVGEDARTPAPLPAAPQAITDPSTEAGPVPSTEAGPVPTTVPAPGTDPAEALRSSIPAGATNQDIPLEADRATAELAERGRLMIAALPDDHIRIATTLRGQVVPTTSGTAPVTITMIQNIKHHLFSGRAVEHTLDGEPVALPFAGHADIAEAWLRMATGDTSRLAADLQLIAHENAELEGMQRGLSQAEAHEAATATADWASVVPDAGHPLLTAMDAAGGVVDEGSYSSDPVRSLEHSLATSAFARVDDAHPGLEQILTDRSVRPDRRMAQDLAAARELHRTHAAAAADSRAQAARLTAHAEQQTDSRRAADLQSAARDAHAAARASQALANDYQAAASQLQTDLDAAIEHRAAQLERAITLIGPAGVLEMLGNPHLPAGSTTPSSGRGRDTHPSVLTGFRQHALNRIGADLGVDLSGATNRQQRVALITAHLSALADPVPANATPVQRAAHAQAQSRLVEQVAAALTSHAQLDPTHDDYRSITNRIFEHARMLFLEAHAELDTPPGAGRAPGRLEFRWTEMGGTPGSTALELEHTGLPVGITHPLGTGTAAANLDGMRGRNGLELKDGYANLLEDGEFPPREARDLANQFAREVAALDGRLQHEAQQVADAHARSRLGEARHTVATAPPELRRQILAERNAVRAGFLADHRPHLDVVSSHPEARAAFQTLVDRDPRLTGHVTVHSSEEHRALMREEVEQGLRARYPGIVEDAAAIVDERIRRGGLPVFMAPAAPPAPASATTPSSPQLYEHGLTTDPDNPGALDHDTLAGLIDGTLTGAGSGGPRPVAEQLSRALGMRITHDTAPDGTATLLAQGPTRSLSIRITTQPTTPPGAAPSIDDDVAITRIVDLPGMRGRGAEEVVEAVVDITLSANLSPTDVAVVLAQEIARTSAELEPDAINNTEDLLTDALGKQVPALISQRAADTDASFSPRDVGRLAGLQVRFDALADLSETARGPARRLVDAELTALGLDLSIAASEDGMPDPDVRQQFFARLQGIPDIDGTSRLKDAIRSFNTNEKGVIPDAPPPVRAFLVKALAAQSVPAAAAIGTAAVVGSSAAMLPVLVATAAGGAIATAASVIADVRKFRSAGANTRVANDGNPRTTDQDRQARRLELEGHEVRTATAEVGGRPDERFGPDADRLRRALGEAHARLAARHDAEVARQDPVRGRDLDALDKIADASAVRFKAMSSGLARALAFGAAPIADVVADHTAIDLLDLTGMQSAALTVAAVGNLVAAAIGGGLLGRLGLTGDPGLDVRKAETENRIQSQKAGVQQAATDAAAQDAYRAQSAQIARLDDRADEQSADADRVAQIAAELAKPDRDHTALRTELGQIAARAAAPMAAEESARRALDTARLEQALDRLVDATERVVTAPLARRLNPFRSLRREIRLAMADVDDATALLEKQYGVRIATSLDELANSPNRAEAVRVLQSLEASLQKKLSVLQTHPENGARVTATLGRYSSGRYSAGGASTLATRIASGMLATGGLTGTSVGTALFAAASATLAGSSGERSIEIANELRKFHDRFGRPDKQTSLVAVNDGTRPGLVRDEIVDLLQARDLEILARVADADPAGPLGSTPDAGYRVDPGAGPRSAAPADASVAPAAPSGEADVASSAAEDPALRRVSSRLSYVARFMTAPVVTAIGDLVGGRPVFSTLAAAAASLGVGPAEWSGKLAEERAPKILEEIQSTLQSDERAAQDVRHQVHRDTPQVDRTPRQQMETLSRSLRDLAREDDRVRARATRRATDLRTMLDVAAPALATEQDPAVHRAVADIRQAVQDALAARQGTPSAGEVLRTVQERRATDRPEDIVAFQRSHIAAARARLDHTSPATRVLEVRVGGLTGLAHRAVAATVNRGAAVTSSATADLDLLRADLDATTTRLRDLGAHGERRAAIDEALGAIGRARQHAAAAAEHLARSETLVQRAARHLAGAHADRVIDAVKVLHSPTFRSGIGPEIQAAQQALDQGRAALREAELVLPRAEAADLLAAVRDAAESARSQATAPLAHAASVTGSAGGDIDTGAIDDTVGRITRSLAGIARVAADAERAAEHLSGDSGLSPSTTLEIIRSAQAELAGHRESLLDDLAVLERHTAVALAQDAAQRSAAGHDGARLDAEHAAQAATRARAIAHSISHRAAHDPAGREHRDAAEAAAGEASAAARRAAAELRAASAQRAAVERLSGRVLTEPASTDTAALTVAAARLRGSSAALAELATTAGDAERTAALHAAYANGVAALDEHAEHAKQVAARVRALGDRHAAATGPSSGAATTTTRDRESLRTRLDEDVTRLAALQAEQQREVDRLSELTAGPTDAARLDEIAALSRSSGTRLPRISRGLATAHATADAYQIAARAAEAEQQLADAQRSRDETSSDIDAVEVRVAEALAEIPADFVAYDAAGRPTAVPAERAQSLLEAARRKLASAARLLSESTAALDDLGPRLDDDPAAVAGAVRLADSSTPRAAQLTTEAGRLTAEARRLVAEDADRSRRDAATGHRIVLEETPAGGIESGRITLPALGPAQQAAHDVAAEERAVAERAAETFAQFQPVGELFNRLADVPRGLDPQVDAAVEAATRAAQDMTAHAQAAQDTLDTLADRRARVREIADRVRTAPRGTDTSVDTAAAVRVAREAPDLAATFTEQARLVDVDAAEVAHHVALATALHVAFAVDAQAAQARADVDRLTAEGARLAGALDLLLADESGGVRPQQVAQARQALSATGAELARAQTASRALDQLAGAAAAEVRARQHATAPPPASASLRQDAEARLERVAELRARVATATRTGLRRALDVGAPQIGGRSAPSAIDDAAIRDAQAQATARTNEVRALLAEGDARSQDAARTALRARQAASRATQYAVELGASGALGSTSIDVDDVARAYGAAAEAGTIADEAHARAVAERHAATVRAAYAEATAAVDPIAGAVSELTRRISGVLAAIVPGTLLAQSAALRGQLAAVGSEARTLTDRLATLHALHDTSEDEVAAGEPSATTLEYLGRQSREIAEQLAKASSSLDAHIARLGLTATVLADADRANRALASIDTAQSDEVFGDYLRTTVALDPGPTALTDVRNALTALADDLAAGDGPAVAEQVARAAALGAAATRHAVDTRIAAEQGLARAASAYGHSTQHAVHRLAALAEGHAAVLTEHLVAVQDVAAEAGQLAARLRGVDASTDAGTARAAAAARALIEAVEDAHDQAFGERAEVAERIDTLRSLSADPTTSIESSDATLAAAADAVADVERAALGASERARIAQRNLAAARARVAGAEQLGALADVQTGLRLQAAQLNALLDAAAELQRDVPGSLTDRDRLPAVRAQRAAAAAQGARAGADDAATSASVLLDLADRADDPAVAAAHAAEAQPLIAEARRLAREAARQIAETTRALREAVSDPVRDLPGVVSADDRRVVTNRPTSRALADANAALAASPEGRALRASQAAHRALTDGTTRALTDARARRDAALARAQRETGALDRDGRAALSDALAAIDRGRHELDRTLRALGADLERARTLGHPLDAAAIRIALPTGAADVRDAVAAVEQVAAAVDDARPALDQRSAAADTQTAELEAHVGRLVAHNQILSDQWATAEIATLTGQVEDLVGGLPPADQATAPLPGTAADRAQQARTAIDEHLAELRQAAQQSRVAVARQTDRHRDVLTGADPRRDQQIAADHERVTAARRAARGAFQEALASMRRRERAITAGAIEALTHGATGVRDAAVASARQAAQAERARLEQELAHRLALIEQDRESARQTRDAGLIAIGDADRIANHPRVRSVERTFRRAVDTAIEAAAAARRDTAHELVRVAVDEQRAIADADLARDRTIAMQRTPHEHRQRREVTRLARLAAEQRAHADRVDPTPGLRRLDQASERGLARINERSLRERIAAAGRRDARLAAIERDARDRWSTADRVYRRSIQPQTSRSELDRRLRLWRLLQTGVTITARHDWCIWDPSSACTCPRSAPTDCPRTPVPPRTPEHQAPAQPSTPEQRPRPAEPDRRIPDGPRPPRAADDSCAHHVPPPRPAPSAPPEVSTPPSPLATRAPAEHGAVPQMPPAGQDAVPSAVDAARRATARLHGHFELVAADHARVRLPGRRPIDLVLTADAAGPRRPVVATRDGQTISLTLSTAASTADIAAEVAGGVTAALLHDLDSSSFGAASVLTRNGAVTPQTRLSRDDLRRLAVLQELLWQLEHTDGPLHRGVVRALGEQIGRMGLDLAAGPAVEARRGLLPPELRDALDRMPMGTAGQESARSK